MQRNSIKVACIILVLFFLVSSYRYEAFIQPPSQETDDYVILLHGLGQSKRSMEKIGKSLSSLGYKVVNVGYPSTKYPIEFLADEILSDIIEPYSKHSQSKIHFVTQQSCDELRSGRVGASLAPSAANPCPGRVFRKTWLGRHLIPLCFSPLCTNGNRRRSCSRRYSQRAD